MRLHNFCRALAALTLSLLLSPILALDGDAPPPCSIQPFAVAIQSASPQEPWMASHRCLSRFSERVLARLEQFKSAEPNPHLRDDLHIAYLTALYAARGDAMDCPNDLATYATLGIRSAEVWPAIVARRKKDCGSLYPALYDENDLWRGGDLHLLSLPPKKPVARAAPERKAA